MGRNFDMRKYVVEYDDVINYHREIVYKNRREILQADNLELYVFEYFRELAKNIVLQHKNGKAFDYNEIGNCKLIHVLPTTPLAMVN